MLLSEERNLQTVGTLKSMYVKKSKMHKYYKFCRNMYVCKHVYANLKGYTYNFDNSNPPWKRGWEMGVSKEGFPDYLQ